jgi:Flp pilus assembly protein TadD
MIRLFFLAWLAGQSPSPDAMQQIQAALVARKQHQVETEIVEFRKATELDPALADAFVNLGAAYMEKGDYGAAITQLKRALEISSDLVVAHQFLGYALLEQGYAAEAIPHLQRVGRTGCLGSCTDRNRPAERSSRQLQRGPCEPSQRPRFEGPVVCPRNPSLLDELGV